MLKARKKLNMIILKKTLRRGPDPKLEKVKSKSFILIGMLLCGSKRRPGASNIFRPIDPEKLSLTERAYYLRHKHLLSDRVSKTDLICLEGISTFYTHFI
jgi:hypothetical protein